MNTKVLLVGIGGGIIVTATLIYPCYIYLPSLFTDSWYSVNTLIAWVLAASAVFELFLIGVLAVKISQSKALIMGSIAGCLAALFAYAAMVAPAAGVYGFQNILFHGLKPEENNLTFVTLIRDSNISIIWWSYISLWASIAVGSLMGTFGALIGTNKNKTQTSTVGFPVSFAIGITLCAALAYLVTVSMYNILIGALLDVSKNINSPPPYPEWTSAVLPIFTAYLWLLLGQVTTWRLVRRMHVRAETRSASASIAGIINLAVPIVLSLLIFFITEQRLWIFYAVLQTISFLVGWISFWDSMKVRRLPKAKSEEEPSLKDYLRVVLPISLAVFILIYPGGINVPLSILMLLIVAIPYLTPGNISEASIAKIINDHYRVQSVGVAATLIGTIANVSVIVLTYRNLLLFVHRYGKDMIPEFFQRMKKNQP